MSIQSRCPECWNGNHSEHNRDWNIRPGLIGGSYCGCNGECDQNYAKKVYDILVEECEAFKGDYWECSSFAYNWPQCEEFRFGGNQGFGGKVWAPGTMAEHAVVTCYPEDDNPERKAARDRANERLRKL